MADEEYNPVLELDDRMWDVADREPIVHPTNRPPRTATRLDFFKRELMPGDFVVWITSTFYTTYYKYGLILHVNHENGFVRLRNHNMNKVTLWNTFNLVILARQGEYDNIPEEYLNRVGIENF